MPDPSSVSFWSGMMSSPTASLITTMLLYGVVIVFALWIAWWYYIRHNEVCFIWSHTGGIGTEAGSSQSEATPLSSHIEYAGRFTDGSIEVLRTLSRKQLSPFPESNNFYPFFPGMGLSALFRKRCINLYQDKNRDLHPARWVLDAAGNKRLMADVQERRVLFTTMMKENMERYLHENPWTKWGPIVAFGISIASGIMVMVLGLILASRLESIAVALQGVASSLSSIRPPGT